jgi:cytochrome c oxidase assembly protein subunit 15
MSKAFIRLSWITLVFILLIFVAGSVVRTTGSGMGCPDWPKCFDCWVPPTSADQLPENYRETYGEYRKKKVEKFSKLLIAMGMEDAAAQILNDPELTKEEPFNARKTWTEYANRLVGFVAGNLVLILLIWVIVKYRANRKLLLLAFINLILMGFEGWLGSIVVATNLVPWIITVHMLAGLVIVAIQIKIIRIARDKKFSLKLKPVFKYLFWFSLILTFVQIVLGSQVRQEIDFMVKETVDRANWISNMQGDFLFHRSFSWLLLLVNLILLWLNHKWHYGIPTLKWIVALVILEFITGILFSYANMPAFSQPVHLLAATILLSIQFYSLDYFKYHRNSMIS